MYNNELIVDHSYGTQLAIAQALIYYINNIIYHQGFILFTHTHFSMIIKSKKLHDTKDELIKGADNNGD